jgi:REP element-mobilizing transposase RayT
MRFIEAAVPALCTRGGWRLISCAAGPNHVHVVLGVDSAIHGKQVRQWLKRWVGEMLTDRHPPTPGTVRPSWWAEGGSARPVKNEFYFDNAKRYVQEQRASSDESERPGRHAPAR